MKVSTKKEASDYSIASFLLTNNIFTCYNYHYFIMMKKFNTD